MGGRSQGNPDGAGLGVSERVASSRPSTVVSRSSAYSKRGETAQFWYFLPCLGLILMFVPIDFICCSA